MNLDTISCMKCGHDMHLEVDAGGYSPPGFEVEYHYYCANCGHVEEVEAVKRTIAGLRARPCAPREKEAMNPPSEEAMRLHIGQRYTIAESEKLRELGYVLVEHRAVSEPAPTYIVTGWRKP